MQAVDGNGNGDAKVAQKRSLNRRKSESANARPRTKQEKEPSRKEGGGGWERRQRWLLSTCLKCSLAKQHNNEVDSSANANPQAPQAQFPLEVPSPPGQAPLVKPILPSRILPRSDTSHPLVSLANQPFAGHISERIEYPSRAACVSPRDGSSGIHLSAPK